MLIHNRYLSKLIAVALICNLGGAFHVLAEESASLPPDGKVLSLDEFISLAIQKDTAFREILIDELTLRYQKALKLPASDFIISVTDRMEFYLDQNREDPETLLSLSQDFPYTGTELRASYEITPIFSTTTRSSEMTFTLTQSIARNAFGRSTRLQDKIVGLEIDVARHQIIEAYEDYLATLMSAYFGWYEAYENLKIGESSYRENQKLLDNIKQRKISKIALPIDVNKITLQVLAKKEKLINLHEKYQNQLTIIESAIRYTSTRPLIAQLPYLQTEPQEDPYPAFDRFEADSRTFRILRLLEEKSSIEVDKEADDLLPSIDFLIGYQREGEEAGLHKGDGLFFLGLSAEWPFPDQVDRAERAIAIVNRDKVALSVKSARYRLYTQIFNLYRQIDREGKLADIAAEKIQLAQAVLDSETENYTYGKVTLNDYIDAVNVLDNNHFNQVLHEMLAQKLIIEWRRLTDQLVKFKQIKSDHPDIYSQKN